MPIQIRALMASGPKQQRGKKRKHNQDPRSAGSAEEVLGFDVRELLGSRKSEPSSSEDSAGQAIATSTTTAVLPEQFTEKELIISSISSTGDGLALDSDVRHVYVVPFTAPGDKVVAKIVKHLRDEHYSLTDFVRVLTPSSMRDNSRIRCPYFSRCSGCQYQMLDYSFQLTHKKSVIEKAYKNFSGLAPEAVPTVSETIGSPLQYGYRTKLTPHFTPPPGFLGRRRRKQLDETPVFKEVPPIGFSLKGRQNIILDIEDCPIATDAVRAGLRSERERVAKELSTFKNGATLLIRENTRRIVKDNEHKNGAPEREEVISDDGKRVFREEHPGYTLEKTCVTAPKETITEFISDYKLQTKAYAFFQNNNSILPIFTTYIRDNVLPRTPAPTQSPIKYLIDAYCGSGLFTITLSSLFQASTGIDISADSIADARHNASMNGVANATFLSSEARNIFAAVRHPPDQTVVVIDPPRKGCDDDFLRQLRTYGPSRVVYVSCNVHTQARDVGFLAQVSEPGAAYEMESLRGFDFFPQTAHVEAVAVLNRKPSSPGDGVLGR